MGRVEAIRYQQFPREQAESKIVTDKENIVMQYGRNIYAEIKARNKWLFNVLMVVMIIWNSYYLLTIFNLTFTVLGLPVYLLLFSGCIW